MNDNNNKIFEIIVCGGGSAGFAAALAAARRGADVLLIERFNCFGGTATTGLNFGFESSIGMHNSVYDELYEKMSELGGTRNAYFDPEIYKYVSQMMLEEAGVTMLFHTFVESPILDSEKIKGINVVNKGGRQTIHANIVIDATGDADVAASVRVPFEKGRAPDGHMQSLTLRSRIGGVRILPEVDWSQINCLFADAIQNKHINVPEYTVGLLDAGGEGVRGERTFNLDMVDKIDATDPWQLSKAELEGRKRVWELLNFVKKNVRGWEDAYLIDTGVHIGVRETRRIKGKYILNKEDIFNCRKFEDAIARCSRWIDLHDPEIFINESPTEYIEKNSLPDGEWYEIPYRCLLPENILNLLIAGRCISTDRAANGSMRIMPICMATGMAAGIAASVAVQNKVSPDMLCGKDLRLLLKTLGADI